MHAGLFALLPLLAACDLSGGVCRDEDVCVVYADSVGNGDGSDNCNILLDRTKGFSTDLEQTQTYSPLKEECPEGDVVGECTFQDIEGVSGTAYFYAPYFDADSARESCRAYLEGTPDSATDTGR